MLFGSNVSMGFGVVSLSLGNPGFPFADGLTADAHGLGHELLGHLSAEAVLLQSFAQGALDLVFSLPHAVGADIGPQGADRQDYNI